MGSWIVDVFFSSMKLELVDIFSPSFDMGSTVAYARLVTVERKASGEVAKRREDVRSAAIVRERRGELCLIEMLACPALAFILEGYCFCRKMDAKIDLLLIQINDGDGGARN